MPEKRSSKRVSWKPAGAESSQPEPPADTFSVQTSDEGVSARPQSNDERLRADKPPHWG